MIMMHAPSPPIEYGTPKPFVLNAIKQIKATFHILYFCTLLQPESKEQNFILPSPMAAVAEDSGSALNTDAATEEVDDTAFLNPASKKAENDDDFVMGVAKQGGQSENDSEMKGGDATSERIMFELLVRVGSDPNISCEDLVSEQFAVLSDAIVADVEDGIGDFIAKHFVDCVRDFPSKLAYIALCAR